MVNTFVDKGIKYVMADAVIAKYNELLPHLKGKRLHGHKMDLSGLSKSLGSEVTLSGNGHNVKVVVSVEALKEYVDEITMKEAYNRKSSNHRYYLERAAAMSRTLVELGLIKKCETDFEPADKQDKELFDDVKGYVKVMLKAPKNVDSHILGAKAMPVNKAQKKAVRKSTPIELIEAAYARIEKRNKLNEKDFDIIRTNTAKLRERDEKIKEAVNTFFAA